MLIEKVRAVAFPWSGPSPLVRGKRCSVYLETGSVNSKYEV